MHSITKSFSFEASHQLDHHDGKCANLHGHSYRLDVELTSIALHETGPCTNMVMDFSTVSAVVKQLVSSHLDHQHLNDTLQTDSPTAEFIAQWCFEALIGSLPLLTAVTVHETASASATYRPVLEEHQNPDYCPFCGHCLSLHDSREVNQNSGICRKRKEGRHSFQNGDFRLLNENSS